MTLLVMQGFDLVDWGLSSTITGLYTTGAQPTRFGYGYSGRSSGTAVCSIPASAEVFFGAAWCCAVSPAIITIKTDANGTSHLVITVAAADGSITVTRGGVTIATAGAAPAWSASGWHYVEFHAIISDTVGVCQVRTDGGSTNRIDFSGDTKNAGTSTNIDTILLQGGGYSEWDDIYICDALGTTNNNFLGDVRVYTLAPNGNGNYSQFVGSDSDSTNNYQLVDEQPYSTTDYVGSATSGNRDSYAMTDLPANATTVFAVQEVAIVAKSDAGAQTIKQMLRVSSTDYETAAQTLSTTYASLRNIREQNPNTSAAWTASGVNGIEAGVRVG